MTFNSATGNITLGNTVINTNQIQTVSAVDLPNVTAFGTSTPSRILIGNGYQGSANSIYAPISPGTLTSNWNASRLMVMDQISVPNTGISVRQGLFNISANLSANISNTSTRIGSFRSETVLGGGTSNYQITATNQPFLASGGAFYAQLGAGTNANLSAIGNVTSTAGVAGLFAQAVVSNYSSANIMIGVGTQLSPNNANTSAYGNATQIVGYYAYSTSGLSGNTSAVPTTTYAAYYSPGPNTSNNIPGLNQSQGTIVRNATNYHAFRNDDPLAKAKLGMLDSFHELNANTATTTGTINIDKANGQVQTIYPTGNITIGTLSGFQTRQQRPDSVYVNNADTVTLVIHQGATPYTVTMPTGNTNIRYAANVSSVGNTANSTTMISITGVYNYNSAANMYLITVSPEFS